MLFPVAPALELRLDQAEVALGRGALRGRGFPLQLRLCSAGFLLRPALAGGHPALPGVMEPLRREGEVPLQPPHLEPRLGQAALHRRAPRLGRMPRLHPSFALPLRPHQPRALLGQGGCELRRARPQPAQLEVEVLELAAHQRERDAEALLDHLAVPLRLAPLAGEAPHLRLHFGDQVFEAGQVCPRLLQASLVALLPAAVEPDSRRFFEQGAALLRLLREQRVDHLRLHHDGRVRAEPGATQQVLDIAQADRRTVQQVVALTRARQTPGYHDFLVGDGEHAVGVVEHE